MQLQYYTKYDIKCHMIFYVTTVTFKWYFLRRSEHIVMDNGWVHPLPKILPSLVINLWWKIVMDD